MSEAITDAALTLRNKILKLFRDKELHEQILKTYGRKGERDIEAFFAENREYDFSTTKIGSGIVAVIEKRKEGRVPTNELVPLMENILELQKKIDIDNIPHRCAFIAKAMVKKGFADGTMTAELVPHVVPLSYASSHALCYKKLSETSWIAVDFTAALYADGLQGNFHALCFHAENFEDLCSLVSKVYGGERWGDTDRRYDYIGSNNRDD